MKTIRFDIGFNNRKPTEQEIDGLKDMGVKHIEVMTKVITTYDFSAGYKINQTDELDDSYAICVMEIPDNWPNEKFPFQEEQLEEELTTMLVGIFGEEDKTPHGELLPDASIWWLDDCGVDD